MSGGKQNGLTRMSIQFGVISSTGIWTSGCWHVRTNDQCTAQRQQLSYNHLTIHEYEFQGIFVEGRSPVLLIGSPDVTGDGCRDAGIFVSVPRERQQSAFTVQQSKSWTDAFFIVDHDNNFIMITWQHPRPMKTCHLTRCHKVLLMSALVLFLNECPGTGGRVVPLPPDPREVGGRGFEFHAGSLISNFLNGYLHLNEGCKSKFVQGWTELNFVKLLYKCSAVYVLVLCCTVYCKAHMKLSQG